MGSRVRVPSAPQEGDAKCISFCYILPTCYQLRVLDGFITGLYPTFPVTTPIPFRYHSEPLPKDLRRNSEGRAKHCRTFAVKNFNPISSVKKQVISQVIKWVCQTLTHPLYLIMVIGFIPLPLYSTQKHAHRLPHCVCRVSLLLRAIKEPSRLAR